MPSSRGQAISAKMTSLWGELTALAYHQTKRLNNLGEQTYLSTNLGLFHKKVNNILNTKMS
jgi:hypothetical protein